MIGLEGRGDGGVDSYPSLWKDNGLQYEPKNTYIIAKSWKSVYSSPRGSLAKQVNFVSGHLHSACIGSECSSA